MLKNNNTIKLLGQFSKKEMERFSLFLESPFHNTDQVVVRLLSSLRKEALEGQSVITSVGLYNYIKEETLKKEEFSPKKQAYLNAKMALLYGQAKEFLVITSIGEHKALHRKSLYDSLIKKKQFTACKQILAKDKKTLEAQVTTSIDDYLLGYQIEKGRLNYLHQNRLLRKEDNIHDLLHQLDGYYIAARQSIQITALSLARVSSMDKHNAVLLDAADSLVQLEYYACQPIIQINQLVIELMKYNENGAYFRLLKLLVEQEPHLSAEQLSDAYSVALNFCIYKIIRGELEFTQHQFDLYKILDERNLLLQNETMNIARLKNIVSLCCKLNNFEWGLALVKKYKNLLNHPDKESVVHVNLGAISFYQRQYKTAVHHFIRVEKISIGYDLDCRVMLLKSYYELDEEYDERTMTIFRTTEMFIRNHSNLSNKHKKGFKNFVQIMINLYRYQHKATKISIASIRKKMERHIFISDKKWLLEKIEELK